MPHPILAGVNQAIENFNKVRVWFAVLRLTVAVTPPAAWRFSLIWLTRFHYQHLAKIQRSRTYEVVSL